MKKAILVAAIGALTLGVNAGDWGKAPVPAKAPIEECLDIGGSISAGYMTDYIFYGTRLARDSVWTDVNYSFESIVPMNIGVWYLNGIDPVGTDELDLYISAEVGSFAGFDTSIGYTHYFFPEAGLPSYGEVGIDISRSLGWFDVSWESNVAFSGRSNAPGGGWYHQFGIERTFGITDTVSLVLGAGVGFADGYWDAGAVGLVPSPTVLPGAVGFGPSSTGSGWNHYFITASLPIELNCRATLTPYLGYNGAPDGWLVDGINAGVDGPQSDILHGGVSLSVSF